ncbi:MAG: SRPBCC domain-containing protein [Phycisphaerales bacterium]|nr:SRPBCC domain-containing protein [Phycisphaerales bacterium]
MSGSLEPLRGEEIFNTPPARLFEALTDLDDLARNIPDVQSASRIDAQTLLCTVKPGFSFLRGTLKSRICLLEARPQEHVRLSVSATGIGMGMEIDARLTIQPHEQGRKSRLLWEAQVTSRSGLISAVPAGLILGAAEKTVREGWEKLRRRVEG